MQPNQPVEQQGSLFGDSDARPERPAGKFPSQGDRYGDIRARVGTPKYDRHLARCESDWQRAAMAAWRQRNPEPSYFGAGSLGWLDESPIPCHCTDCGTPALIFPPEPGPKQRNGYETLPGKPGCSYCICPRCSFPAAANEASA